MSALRVAVAYSGGRDSTALLHATLLEAQASGIEVHALHVHHGLSLLADQWLAHCEDQCSHWAARGLPVHFSASRVGGHPSPGESVEAWARSARYRALRELALLHGVGLVLLAHHRRDQAETLLLQALRGAGIAGLAAMPQAVRRGDIVWHRPWLGRPSDEIDAYVREQRLEHIVDDSNADVRHARNRLRLQVWPALTQAFPQAEVALAASAGWAQEAAVCLDDLARIDLATMLDGDGLLLAPWSALTLPRRSNALRAWIRQRAGSAAPASLVSRLLLELTQRRSGRWPFAGGELRCHRGRLTCIAGAPTAQPASAARESVLCVRRAGSYRLPGWGGSLRIRRVPDGGVPLAWLGQLELRERAGAEKFQAGIGRPPRSLKKQFQARGLPAWQRNGPLLYAGGQLVFVPGLGLDARVLALPGQPQMQIEWWPQVESAR